MKLLEAFNIIREKKKSKFVPFILRCVFYFNVFTAYGNGKTQLTAAKRKIFASFHNSIDSQKSTQGYYIKKKLITSSFYWILKESYCNGYMLRWNSQNRHCIAAKSSYENKMNIWSRHCVVNNGGIRAIQEYHSFRLIYWKNYNWTNYSDNIQ